MAYHRKMPQLVVCGLGYVGLPLVQVASQAQLAVTGFDLSKRVVDGLNAGRSHIDDISDEQVEQMLAAGFTATTDEAVFATAEAISICVPTPLGAQRQPDMSAVVGACEAISRNLRPGTLIVLESTTYPGTTDDLVVPILEQSGLTAGTDFYVAYSPERVDPGNPTWGIKNTPKVVGGVNQASRDRAIEFYGQLIDTIVPAGSTRVAETTKLLENTYRHVNIALANEFARMCHALDIDVWDVISCASTKPFGFQPFYPGPGVGGHCIPIDPHYLSFTVESELGIPFRFVELAQEINAAMPAYVFQRITEILNERERSVKGSTILLVGVTYKPNISDQRESPVKDLGELLMRAGSHVLYHDPLVPMWRLGESLLQSEGDLYSAAGRADLSVLLQPHDSLDLDQLLASALELFDVRGSVPGADIRL